MSRRGDFAFGDWSLEKEKAGCCLRTERDIPAGIRQQRVGKDQRGAHFDREQSRLCAHRVVSEEESSE